MTEYQVNGRRSLERARFSVAHLRGAFDAARAQSLDTSRVRDYIAARQAPRKAEDGTVLPGASNATINRELAALTRLHAGRPGAEDSHPPIHSAADRGQRTPRLL